MAFPSLKVLAFPRRDGRAAEAEPGKLDTVEKLVEKWITENDRARSATARMTKNWMRALEPLRGQRLDRLLDIGCGFGGVTKLVGEYLEIPELYGIDRDSNALKEAEQKGVTAQQLNIGKARLPFPDDYFDLVVSFGMLDHFSFFDEFLEEVFRMVRPGGYTLISLPNLGSWHNRLSLLLGYQPRDVEISREILAGVHPWYKTDGDPTGHIRSVTVPAFRELMAHHGFECVGLTGARPRGRKIPGVLALADMVLTKKAALARRFFYLGVKLNGVNHSDRVNPEAPLRVPGAGRVLADQGDVVVLGGGMTGLAAGFASHWPVFEAERAAGGICCSYYVRANDGQRLSVAPKDGEAYHFEIGGGHWIFGGDPVLTRFIRSLAPVKSYSRRSSVFFPEQSLYVPYPLQNHLGFLPEELRVKALTEIVAGPKGNPRTMADWLGQSFGATLTEIFFGPFHELYTAGLWTRVAPQDGYKTPVDAALVIRGASQRTPAVGYNATFLYPEEGLNTLAGRMAEQCEMHYGKRVVRIDVRGKEVFFEDGASTGYGRLISSLPLNKMVAMTGLEVGEEPDPFTSVLVLNLGARRGPKCPDDHWIYVPRTRSGFHRVGFYSNVDRSFLPRSSQKNNERVSIYVERAYLGGERPTGQEIATYAAAVVRELQEWEFIGEAEVVDPTWIDVAYTWSWPGSQWRANALGRLEESDIIMVGRYAKWKFQGIADSIRDGLFIGAASRGGKAVRPAESQEVQAGA